ncbi:MAG TPA: hypothetical protein VFQ45_22510 [Longimicrobium sp.]|nr:hypothetical protein [Longimicrobium sp.]
MASHSELYPPSIPLRIARRPSGAALGAMLLAVLVGVAALFLAGGERAWHALHLNWMYWSSIAIGMVIFAVALHLTNARWSWSIRRFALAGVSFLPVSFVLFLVMMIGGRHVYFHHWLPSDHGNPVETDPVLHAKAAWLNFNGMMVRDIVALLVLFGLATYFARLMLRTDVYGLERTGRRGWPYTWLTRGYGQVEDEAQRAHNRALYVGVFTALAFAFGWGLIGIDVGMTTLPHFFSTMFPVAFFIGAFHGALAMTALQVVIWRGPLRLADYITAKQFHDLGKLIFAFAVFWMYINWSQYVVIWYGLLPYEQEYFVNKFSGPYGKYVQAAVLMIFVTPFLGLLSRAPKKVPKILATFAVIILVGHYLERFLLATPNYWTHEGAPLGLPEIGVAVGFLGLFMFCYTWFLSTFPVLPSPASLAAAGTGMVSVPDRGPHAVHA